MKGAWGEYAARAYLEQQAATVRWKPIFALASEKSTLLHPAGNILCLSRSRRAKTIVLLRLVRHVTAAKQAAHCRYRCVVAAEASVPALQPRFRRGRGIRRGGNNRCAAYLSSGECVWRVRMKLFDLHCDTLYECCETGKHLRENDLHVNFAAAQRYTHYAQFFALFCGARAPSETHARGRDCLLDTPTDERLRRMLQTGGTRVCRQRRLADVLPLSSGFAGGIRRGQSGGVFIHRGGRTAARSTGCVGRRL